MSGYRDLDQAPRDLSLDAPRRRRLEECDRCGESFMEGYRWSGLGIPLALCKDCAQDVEEAAASYGERGRAAEQRLLSLLRGIGAGGRPHRPNRSPS